MIFSSWDSAALGSEAEKFRNEMEAFFTKNKEPSSLGQLSP